MHAGNDALCGGCEPPGVVAGAAPKPEPKEQEEGQATPGKEKAKAKAKAKGKAKAKAKAKASVPQQLPTFANVPYGEHAREVLDFYKAESATPTPLVVYIHGGGWMNGDKGRVGTVDLKKLLAEGISVAAINYRFLPMAYEADVKPPSNGRWKMRPGRFSSSGPRRRSGTSTRRGSPPRVDRPAPARPSGWRCMTTWPSRRAATRWPASPPA